MRTAGLGLLGLLVLTSGLAAGPDEPDWARILGLYRRARDAHQQGRHDSARWLYAQAARVPEGTPELQRRAVERLNHHRMHAMLVPVMPDARVARAAQAHADYLKRHTGEGALTLAQAHDEVRGRRGFTGEGPGDRIRHQGLAGGSTEAISSVLEPEEAVDHLVNSVYHRSALFRQEARYLGFGASGRSVIDLAWKRGDEEEGTVWYYPGPGQADVPPRFPEGETPDPMPGATYPVGSPVSLGTAGGMPTLASARLEGPSGPVRLRALHDGSAPRADLMGDFLYLVPEAPLEEDTRYRCRARLTGPDGLVRNLDWSFTTGSQVPGEEIWQAEVTDLSYTPREVRTGTRVRFQADVKASHPDKVRLRWTVDGEVLADGDARTLTWTVPGPGDHEIRATAHYGDESTANGYQVLHLILGGTVGGGRPLSEVAARDPGADLWAVRIQEFGHEPSRFRHGDVLRFRVRFDSTHPEALRVRWRVDGQEVRGAVGLELSWRAEGSGDHTIEVEGYFPGVEGAFARGRIDVHL